MSYQIEVQSFAAQSALVMKCKVSVDQAGEAIGSILMQIGTYLGEHGYNPSGAPFTRTFSHKDEMLEFEAGFPISCDLEGGDGMIRTELPNCKVAVTTHVGSQESSPEAYKALHAWMKKHGQKEAGAPWEVYLSPEGTSEIDSKMQVFYPIR